MRNDFLVFPLQPEINAARASAYLQSDRRAEKNIFRAAFRTNAVCSARACVGRFGFHVNETIVSLFVWNVINAREKRVRRRTSQD